MKLHAFDPDPAAHPAYGTDFPAATNGVYGEWERLPHGGIFLAPGNYSLDFLLTEESFHESGLGGTWAHAVHGPAYNRTKGVSTPIPLPTPTPKPQ